MTNYSTISPYSAVPSRNSQQLRACPQNHKLGVFSLSKNQFRYFSTSIQKRQRKSDEPANKTEKLKNEQKRCSVKFKTSIPGTIMFIVVRNSGEPPHSMTLREYGFERMNEVNWIIGKEMEFHIYKLSN